MTDFRIMTKRDIKAMERDLLRKRDLLDKRIFSPLVDFAERRTLIRRRNELVLKACRCSFALAAPRRG